MRPSARSFPALLVLGNNRLTALYAVGVIGIAIIAVNEQIVALFLAEGQRECFAESEQDRGAARAPPPASKDDREPAAPLLATTLAATGSRFFPSCSRRLPSRPPERRTPSFLRYRSPPPLDRGQQYRVITGRDRLREVSAESVGSGPRGDKSPKLYGQGGQTPSWFTALRPAELHGVAV
jgi:hypothetical protein